MKFNNTKRKSTPRCLRALLLGGLAISLPLAGIAQNEAQGGQAAQNAQQSQTAQGTKNAQQSQAAQNAKGSEAAKNVNLGQVSDDSYLSLNGTVESVAPHSFILSYNNGEDRVTVEMDDGDRDADAYSLLTGDKVTVYGVMDRDMFEAGKIEASSVYVEKLNTFFYASAVDEEDYFYYPLMSVVTIAPVGSSQSGSSSSGSSNGAGSQANSSGSQMDGSMPVLWAQGEVSEVENDSFSLAAGDTEITVTLDELSDNPLDDEGYRKIEAGDVVSVRGRVDGDFFDDAKLAADSVVKIHDKEDI